MGPSALSVIDKRFTLQGPGLTLQAASKYDAVHEAERLDRLTERALMTKSGRVQQFSAAVKRDDNVSLIAMPDAPQSSRLPARMQHINTTSLSFPAEAATADATHRVQPPHYSSHYRQRVCI